MGVWECGCMGVSRLTPTLPHPDTPKRSTLYFPATGATPMLILRIRHAETALADGRLDEVFDLVRDPKLRSHRRGQDLITRLVNALEKRGRDHLNGARYTAALTDCEKAQQLGGDLPQLLALRNEAMDAMADDRRNERLKATAVAAARNEIDNGRLAAGERLLAVASVNDTRAGALLQELGARHNLVDS